VNAWDSGGKFEHFVDELILTSHISSAHPSNLSLAQFEDRFITLNRSSRRMEFSVLLDDVVQVLYGPMKAVTAESPFLLNSRDRRGVDARQVRVDDARLWMRPIPQSLAKQPFGGIRVALGGQQEIDLSNLPNRLPDTDNTSGPLTQT
jgi:hypothetical protein